MKKQILLPFVLLGAAGLITSLGACQPRNQEEKQEEGYGVAITNKDALQETWYAGTSRDIDIELTPAGNVMAEFTTGALKIESSNPDVVSVTGTSLNGLAEGSADVTVKYHGWKDTVNLTIQPAQQEPAHVVATVSEILQNLADGKEKDVIYEVEAYVVAWQTGKTDATKYGNYMLADAADETDASKQILVYGSSANTEAFTITWSSGAYSYTQGDDAKDFLTNDVTKDVGIGSKIKLEAIAYKYNTTPEISGIVKTVDNSGVVHHDIPEPAVVESSLAAFIADTQGNGAKAFHFSAEIKAFKDGSTKDKYGNMKLTDGTNDLTVYGSTATATALAWSSDAGMYAFTNPKDFDTNASTKDLNVGDTVEVKFIRADYNGAVQGTGIILSSTAGEGGGETVPEPAVETRTLAQFIAGENTKAKAYNVTAEIKAFKSGATKDKYGNMTLTDGTNDLVVYGATMTASALAWNNADAYGFSNPQDFMTNATSNALNIGDTITMKMIRCDFTKDGVTTIEGQGVITNIVPGEGGGEGGEGGGGEEQGNVLATADFTGGSIPTGWEYYDEGGYAAAYYSGKGLKLAFEGKGAISPAFAAQTSIKVTIDIKALNENTKTAASSAEHIFTIYALNGSGEVVATAGIDELSVAQLSTTVSGTGIVKAKVVYTKYFKNANNKYVNVALGGVTVEKVA